MSGHRKLLRTSWAYPTREYLLLPKDMARKKNMAKKKKHSLFQSNSSAQHSGGLVWMTAPPQGHGAGLFGSILATQPSYVGRLTMSLSPEGY